MASPDAAPEPSCVHVTLAVNGAQAAAAGQQLVSCDVSLQAMPSPWQVQRPVGDGTGDEGDVGAGGEDVELTVGSVTRPHAGAVEALKAARTDVQGLREERAAMVAQVTTSESRRVRVARCQLPANAKLTAPPSPPPPQSSPEPAVCDAGG